MDNMSVFKKALAESMGKYKLIVPTGASGPKLSTEEEAIADRIEEMMDDIGGWFDRSQKGKTVIDLKRKQATVECEVEVGWAEDNTAEDREEPEDRPVRRGYSRPSRASQIRAANKWMNDRIREDVTTTSKHFKFDVVKIDADVEYEPGGEGDRHEPGWGASFSNKEVKIVLGWK
jgi:hypothetical protein